HYSFDNLNNTVECARKAFSSWRKLSIKDRISYVENYREVLINRKSDLASIISREVGKPLWESTQEVDAMISKVDITINYGLKLIEGFDVERASGDIFGQCTYKARGVLGVLGPFNFPGHLPNGHFIPALLTGNCVIFKPSELTPLSGQLIAEIIHKAGFPQGVFNLIQGDGRLGSKLVEHEGLDGILFTGSYNTGLSIKKATIDQPWKILALEMGGKNSTIILNDAPFDLALYETLFSSLVTTGQRCSSTSKIILEKKIAKSFLKRLKEEIVNLKIAYAFDDKKPFMGPLITEKSVQNFLNSQLTAIKEGHEKILDGKRLSLEKKGFYISPAIFLINGSNYNTIYQTEEIFAPNLAIYIVDNLETAIDIANTSDYRLVTSIFTKSEKNFKTLLNESKSGLINWNKSTVGASSKLPFGGGGKSGNNFPTALFASYYCTYPVSSLVNNTPKENMDFSMFHGN
ncbi:MAG: aldehyde dehydrogenase family protein, partial [Spirochaetota bacterium]|nr:aldehyde dehydrogenase family protein [Spirochaetota bacterium]